MECRDWIIKFKRCVSASSATACGAAASRPAVSASPVISSVAGSGAASLRPSSPSTTTASPAAVRAASARPLASDWHSSVAYQNGLPNIPKRRALSRPPPSNDLIILYFPILRVDFNGGYGYAGDLDSGMWRYDRRIIDKVWQITSFPRCS